MIIIQEEFIKIRDRFDDMLMFNQFEIEDLWANSMHPFLTKMARDESYTKNVDGDVRQKARGYLVDLSEKMALYRIQSTSGLEKAGDLRKEIKIRYIDMLDDLSGSLLIEKSSLTTGERKNAQYDNLNELAPIRASEKIAIYRGEKSTFVGRKEDKLKIKELLKSPGKRICITGPGGTGKSALAFKAVHECEEAFDLIIPFYFEAGMITFSDFLSEFSRRFVSISSETEKKYDIERRKNIICDALSKNRHVLIILDNYETVSELLNEEAITSEDVPQSIVDDAIQINFFVNNNLPKNASVLVTSRQKNNRIDQDERIEPVGLSPEEGRELFIRLAGDDHLKTTGQIEKALYQLIEKTGGHPLSIEILSRSYEGGGTRELEEMSGTLGISKVNLSEPTERLKSLKSCFDYSLNRLDAGLRDFFPKLTFFHSPFLLSAVIHIFGEERRKDIARLYRRSLVSKIESDERGDKIQDSDCWLYTLHPMIRKYLETLAADEHSLIEEYGEKFSEYCEKLLDETYKTIGRDRQFLSFGVFNSIYHGADNDFDRAFTIAKNSHTKTNILLSLGQILSTIGLYEKSLAYYKKSLEINEGLNNKVAIAKDYNNIGTTLSSMGYHQEALKYHKRALSIDEDLKDEDGQPKDKVAIAKDYNNIGRVLYRTGNFPEALDYFYKALNIYKILNHKLNEALQLNNIGLALCGLVRYEEALKHQKKALQIHDDMGDKVSIAFDSVSIGLTLHLMGRWSEALEYHNNALSIYQILRDKVNVARTYYHTGTVLYSMNKYDEALKNLDSALELSKILKDDVSIATDTFFIGIIHHSLGNYDKSLDCIKKAMEMHEKLDDKINVAVDANNAGWLFYNMGRYEEALQYHRKALGINEELGYRAAIAKSYHNMGLTLSALERYEEALQYHRKALVVDEELEDSFGIPVDNNNIGWVLHKMKDYHTALEYFKKAVEISRFTNWKLFDSKRYILLSLGEEKGNNPARKNTENRSIESTLLYNSACSAARIGDVANAISELKIALDAAKEDRSFYIDFAIRDSNFEDIRESEQFRMLIR